MAGRPVLAVILALGAVTTAGLALRTLGLDFGLPLVDARPDERNVIIRAISLSPGDPNPRFFNYPSGYVYLLAGLARMWALGAVTRGLAPTTDAALAGFFVDPKGLVMLSRWCVAIASALTIPATFLLGRRLGGDRVGLLAAAAAAGCFLMVREGHFGVTDTPMTLLVVLAMWGAVRVRERRTVGAAVAAGALAGLAAGFKYSAALLALPLVLALVMDPRRERPAIRPAWPALAAALLALAAVFFLTTPYALLDWARFQADVGYEFSHLSGPAGAARGWWTHPAVNLRHGLGEPFLLAAAVGVVVCLWRREAAAVIVLSFPLAYYLALGSGRTAFVRYALPLAPFACVAAAVAVDSVAGLVASRWQERGRAVAAAVLVTLVVAPSTARAARFDRLLGEVDTRAALARWLERSVGPDARIGWLGDPWSIPLVYDTIDEPSLRGWLPPADAWRDRVAALRRATGRSARPITWLTNWPRVAATRIVQARPEFLVVETGPIPLFATPPGMLASLVPPGLYELVLVLDPLSTPGARPIYDPLDAFFVPLSGLDEVRRPGPALTVYRRSGAG